MVLVICVVHSKWSYFSVIGSSSNLERNEWLVGQFKTLMHACIEKGQTNSKSLTHRNFCLWHSYFRRAKVKVILEIFLKPMQIRNCRSLVNDSYKES